RGRGRRGQRDRAPGAALAVFVKGIGEGGGGERGGGEDGDGAGQHGGTPTWGAVPGPAEHRPQRAARRRDARGVAAPSPRRSTLVLSRSPARTPVSDETVA